MKYRTGLIAAVMTSAMLLSACGGAQDGNAGSSVPAAASETRAAAAARAGLAERHQKRLDEAMANARAGKSPMSDCTMVTGSLAGRPPAPGSAPNPANVAAYQACYVDASVAYIRAKASEATAARAAGEDSNACSAAHSHITVLEMSLGQYAVNVGLDRGTLRRQIAEQLGRGILDQCGSLENLFE
jgi:hypothetical protein